MLLRTKEPGHPMRCGFGNSRDRPRASRASIRFSSWLNSCSSVRTPCSLMKSLYKRQVSLPRGICTIHSSPFKPSFVPTEEGAHLADCVAKSQFGLRFRQAEMLCNFMPGIPVLSGRPDLAGPLIHPSNGFLNLNRLLKDSLYLRMMRRPQSAEVTI